MASVGNVILKDESKLYASGLSIPEVAKKVLRPLSSVRKTIMEDGIKLRTRIEGVRLAARSGRLSHAKGKRRFFSNQWKENISSARFKWSEKNARGYRITAVGYVEFTKGPHKGCGVHKVLMEAKIGRKLLPNEVVHHLDENKRNNNIENLALMTRAEHTHLHRKMRVKKWQA